MSMPGFSAELSVYRTQNPFNAARRAGSREARVTPAVPTRGTGNVWANCVTDCMDGCGNTSSCRSKCRQSCSAGVTEGGPSGPPDPVNCDLCKGGCLAWTGWCYADQAAALSAVTALGPWGALATIGVGVIEHLFGDPCAYIKNQCLSNCPC